MQVHLFALQTNYDSMHEYINEGWEVWTRRCVAQGDVWHKGMCETRGCVKQGDMWNKGMCETRGCVKQGDVWNKGMCETRGCVPNESILWLIGWSLNIYFKWTQFTNTMHKCVITQFTNRTNMEHINTRSQIKNTFKFKNINSSSSSSSSF